MGSLFKEVWSRIRITDWYLYVTDDWKKELEVEYVKRYIDMPKQIINIWEKLW